MRKRIEVKMPYLVKSGSGIAFVEYRVYNPKTDSLERFRVYKGFSKCKTDQEIAQLAEQIIKEFTGKLKNGWRPWSDTVYHYIDEIDYETQARSFGRKKTGTSHIRKHLSGFLELKKNDVSAKSYQSYQSKTRLFALWLENQGYGELKIYQITNDIVVEFFNHLINERALDRVTIAKYRQNIGSMFRYFKSKKLIAEIPMEDLPRSNKRSNAGARHINDRDMMRYLDYVVQHDKQLFLASVFQLFLLIRPNRELRLLKVHDLDMQKGLVYINDVNAKTTARVLTMPNALMEIVEKYGLAEYPYDYYIFGKGGMPGHQPVGINSFNYRFNLIKQTLGFPSGYKFYSLKHTGAGKLLESGATLAELMSHLGHRRFESTIRYVRNHFGERSEKIVNFRPDFLNGLL